MLSIQDEYKLLLMRMIDQTNNVNYDSAEQFIDQLIQEIKASKLFQDKERTSPPMLAGREL